MQRWLSTFTLALAMLGLAAAQDRNSAPPPQNSPAQQDSNEAAGGGLGSTAFVELTKTLDAKKLKVGDPVNARVIRELRASDGTYVPPGSVVRGHVTAATARTKGTLQSSISLAFDTILLKNGQQVPLKATIQAVGAPPIVAVNPFGGADSPPAMTLPGSPNPPGTLSPAGPLGGGTPVGGFPQPQPNAPQTNGSSGDSPSPGGLTTQSTGVVGLRNIELQPNSTLTSTGKDLKLDSGTEMVLHVQSR